MDVSKYEAMQEKLELLTEIQTSLSQLENGQWVAQNKPIQWTRITSAGYSGDVHNNKNQWIWVTTCLLIRFRKA